MVAPATSRSTAHKTVMPTHKRTHTHTASTAGIYKALYDCPCHGTQSFLPTKPSCRHARTQPQLSATLKEPSMSALDTAHRRSFPLSAVAD